MQGLWMEPGTKDTRGKNGEIRQCLCVRWLKQKSLEQMRKGGAVDASENKMQERKDCYWAVGGRQEVTVTGNLTCAWDSSTYLEGSCALREGPSLSSWPQAWSSFWGICSLSLLVPSTSQILRVEALLPTSSVPRLVPAELYLHTQLLQMGRQNLTGQKSLR